MATIEQRGQSWRVYWRRGGRGGSKESTTWPNELAAIQAADIAKAHRHQLTADQVYDLLLGPVADTDPNMPTVAEWAGRWLDARTRITPGTRAQYAGQLRREIVPALGHLRLTEVTGEHVAKLLRKLAAKFGPATVTRYYSVSHAMFRFAVAEKLIDDNPARRTDFVRDLVADDDTGEDVRVYLERWEFDLIYTNIRPDARPLVRFLAGTGARFHEATAVPVDAVKLAPKTPARRGNLVHLSGRAKAGTVQIRRAWKQNGKGGWYLGATKGRSKRTLGIATDLAESLRPLVEGRAADDLVFRAPGGTAIHYSNFLHRRWEPAVVAAMRCSTHPPAGGGRRLASGETVGEYCRDNGGVRHDGKPCGAKTAPGWDRCRTHIQPPPEAVSTCDCPGRLKRRPTPHDLRHTHAAWLFSAGVPPLTVSRRLGHKQLSTTSEIYGGLMPETEDQVIAALDAVMGDGAGRRGSRRRGVA